MIVAVARPQRPAADLADLTSKEIIDRGWRADSAGDEAYVIQFAVNLSADEEAAIRRRLTTANAVEEELHRRGAVALGTNRTFREQTVPQIVAGAEAIIANPTLTQANMRALAQGLKAVTNQMDAVTQQSSGLIRLAQNMLDAVD